MSSTKECLMSLEEQCGLHLVGDYRGYVSRINVYIYKINDDVGVPIKVSHPQYMHLVDLHTRTDIRQLSDIERTLVSHVVEMHYAMQELEEQHELAEDIERLLSKHGWVRELEMYTDFLTIAVLTLLLALGSF